MRTLLRGAAAVLVLLVCHPLGAASQAPLVPAQFERWRPDSALEAQRPAAERRASARRTSPCADEWMAGAMLGGGVGLIVGPLLAGYANPGRNHPRVSFPLVALGAAAVGAFLGAALAGSDEKQCRDEKQCGD